MTTTEPNVFDRTKYDAVAGATELVQTYTGLYELAIARREWGARGRDAGMSDLWVLGSYELGSTGGIDCLSRKLTAEDRATAPPVMTRDEGLRWWREIAARRGYDARTPWQEWNGSQPYVPIPPPHIRCSRCNGEWTVVDAGTIEGEMHDSAASDAVPLFSLASYIGKTLREAARECRRTLPVLYVLDQSIRNDRWMMWFVPSIFRTPRMWGWRTQYDRDPEITWNYRIQQGDETNPKVCAYYHAACYEELQRERTREWLDRGKEELQRSLRAAGFEEISIVEKPLPAHFPAPTVSDRIWYYFAVTTSLGNFGVLIKPIVWGKVLEALDCNGTGVDVRRIATRDSMILYGLGRPFEQMISIEDTTVLRNFRRELARI